MRTSWFCALFLSLTPAALAGDGVLKDRKAYVGTWQATSVTINGNKAKDEDVRKARVVNEADGRWAILVEGKALFRGTHKIDPTKKPRAIDMLCTEGDAKGKTYLGIYELRNDTRKVCYAEAGEKRPTEFSSKPGSQHILAEFRRVKK